MSFDHVLRDAEHVDLSESDIRKILGFNAKIISYDKLRHEETVESILGPQECVIILYQNHNAISGHWVCLWKKQNIVHFFDSYGLKYDEELRYEKFNFRDLSGKGHLSHILERSNYTIKWNRFSLQQKRQDINTCGRHICVRLKFRNLENDEYIKMIRSSTYNPDMLVSAMTLLFSL